MSTTYLTGMHVGTWNRDSPHAGADPYTSYASGSDVLQAVVKEHGCLAPFSQLANREIEKRGWSWRTLLLSTRICCPRERSAALFVSCIESEALLQQNQRYLLPQRQATWNRLVS